MTRTRILGIVLAVVLALAGAVALTGYAAGADARAFAGTRLESVYVAKTMIPAHTSGEKVETYLAVRRIPATAVLPGRVVRLAQLKGMTSTATIEQGEQLIAARWTVPSKQAAPVVTMRPDMEAVTVALPVEQAVGGQLKAGDTVGVIIASSDDSPSKASLATQKLHNVLVLKVQTGSALPAAAGKPTAGSTTAIDTQMITLALETDGATQLVWGQKFGSVWLTLEQSTTDHGASSTAKAGSCASTGAGCTPVHGGRSIDAAN